MTDKFSYSGLPEHVQDAIGIPYIVDINISMADVPKFLKKLDIVNQALQTKSTSVISLWYPPLKRGEMGGGNSYIWVEL